MSCDRALLDQWCAGDANAGRQLFERHYPAVYRFFDGKIANGAEDLVQQTFEACMTNRHRITADAGFRGYLFGIARNLLRQHFRRSRVRGEPVAFDEHSVYDLDPSPSARVLAKAEQRLLLEALRRIPIDQQITFELYYWQRLTAPEMAEVLGITERGIRSRIHRAKQELKRTMEAISDSRAILESTMTNLDTWAEQLRDATEPRGT